MLHTTVVRMKFLKIKLSESYAFIVWIEWYMLVRYAPTRVEFQDEYGDWISGVVMTCIDAEHRGILTDEQANSWQNTFLPSVPFIELIQ